MPLDGWGVVVVVGEVLSPTVIDNNIDLLMGGAGGVVRRVSLCLFSLCRGLSERPRRILYKSPKKKRNDIPRHFCWKTQDIIVQNKKQYYGQ